MGGTAGAAMGGVRALLTTRGSAGHLLPLVPFGHALVDAGHQVLVAAQAQHRGNVERTGLAFAPVGEPASEAWMPLMADFATLDLDTANELMIGEFFAGIDTRAALPGLRDVVEAYEPDLIVRESWEFASTLVADEREIPLARVGLGLASIEELSIDLAAAPVDETRRAAGLAPDPAGDRLRAAAYFTHVPAPLDDPAATAATAHRVAGGELPRASSDRRAPWRPTDSEPLVYVTLGSVAAAAHLPYYPNLYRKVLDALAGLDARVVLTIGDDRDLGELGPLPSNAHVERWIPHDAIVPHADVVVCHGGFGSTLGTLRHGVPLVVLPLFSIDQWANAAAVARVGAGLALDRERHTRPVLGLPGDETIGELRDAVEQVLATGSHRRAAERIADAERASLPLAAAVDELVAIAGRRPVGTASA